MSHHKIVKDEFKKQSINYDEIERPANRQEVSDWCVDVTPVKNSDYALDIGCGTGIFTSSLSPFVSKIVGVDISPDMLEKATSSAKEKSLTNIKFVESSGEKLPFEDNEFTLVVSRLAFHHFQNPIDQFSEMARVCSGEGTLCLIDLLAPSDKDLAEKFNNLERKRDPSHAVALSEKEVLELFNNLSLPIPKISSHDFPMSLDNYLDLTNSDEAIRQEFTIRFQAELNGGEQTGFRPFLKDNKFQFMITLGSFVAKNAI